MNDAASQSNKTERITSDTGDVLCGVPIPVMFRSATPARPLPDSQACLALGATNDPAARAGLRRVGFVHFAVGHPCVIAFVSEEAAQH